MARPRDHFARNKTPARNLDRRFVAVVSLPDPLGRRHHRRSAAVPSVFLGTVDFEPAAVARAHTGNLARPLRRHEFVHTLVQAGRRAGRGPGAARVGGGRRRADRYARIRKRVEKASTVTGSDHRLLAYVALSHQIQPMRLQNLREIRAGEVPLIFRWSMSPKIATVQPERPCLAREERLRARGREGGSGRAKWRSGPAAT